MFRIIGGETISSPVSLSATIVSGTNREAGEEKRQKKKKSSDKKRERREGNAVQR